MTLYDKKPQKPTMTSREAAALIVSEGSTDDADLANLMVEGKALDPDRLQRSYYRRAVGFDLTTYADEAAHKWIAVDEELNLRVTGAMSENPDPIKRTDEDGLTLARMVMRLKRKHDKASDTPEGEVVENMDNAA